MIRGFIFDLEDVVIEMDRLYFDAFKSVMEKYFIELNEENFKEYFHKQGLRGILDMFSDAEHACGIEVEDVLEILRDVKIQLSLLVTHTPISFDRDVVEFIHRVQNGHVELKEIGKVGDTKLAIVSNFDTDTLHEILKYHNLIDVFSVKISPLDYTRARPSPDCYRTALTQLDLPPTEVVGISCAPLSITAFSVSEIASIGLTNTHPAKELKASLTTPSLCSLVL